MHGLPPAGNAPPPAACGSPVTSAMLGARVERPIPIVVAEVPWLPRRNPVAAAGTAHQSCIHERSQALARLLVPVAVAAESGARWLHFGSSCRVWPE
jgi:hypothetical protein